MAVDAEKAHRQVSVATWITAPVPCTAIDGLSPGRASGDED